MNPTILDILVKWNYEIMVFGKEISFRSGWERNFNPNVTSKNRGKSNKEVPIVLTYHLKLKSLNRIFTKNIYLLYLYKEMNKVFTPKPVCLSIRWKYSLDGSSYRVETRQLVSIVGWSLEILFGWELVSCRNPSIGFHCGLVVGNTLWMGARVV